MKTTKRTADYETDASGAPVVHGWLQWTRGSRNNPPRLEIRFRCDGCRKEHIHGGGERGAAEAWRVSHCWNPDSPLYGKSVVIRLDPDAEPRPAPPWSN